MKKILFLFLLSPSFAFALGVESGDSVPGMTHYDFIPPASTSFRSAASLQPASLVRLDENPGAEEIRGKELKAIHLMLKGKPREAAQILAKLNNLNNGADFRYNIPFNLATAYELSGDYEAALDINRVLIGWNLRNKNPTPDINFLVVQAKIADGKTGQTFSGRLLEIPNSLGSGDPVRIGENTFSAKLVKQTLFRVLQERLLFSKAPDPYVADLLYTHAILEANLGSPSAAIDQLKLAGEYGFPDPQLLLVQHDRFEILIEQSRERLFFGMSLGLIVAGFLCAHGRRKRWQIPIAHAALSSWEYLKKQFKPDFSLPSYHTVQGHDRF